MGIDLLNIYYKIYYLKCRENILNFGEELLIYLIKL